MDNIGAILNQATRNPQAPSRGYLGQQRRALSSQESRTMKKQSTTLSQDSSDHKDSAANKQK